MGLVFIAHRFIKYHVLYTPGSIELISRIKKRFELENTNWIDYDAEHSRREIMVNIIAFGVCLALADICFACEITSCASIPNPVEIMTRYPDAYEVQGIEGTWHQVFAMDNSGSTSSQSYTETYSMGYSYVDSSTTTEKWSVESGASFKGASIKAGYEKTVSYYTQDSWSTSQEKSLTINVPAGATANILQRNILSQMSWTKRVCYPVGMFNLQSCVQPDGELGLRSFMGVIGSEPADCGVCQYDKNFKDITVGFDTNCYINTKDIATANAFCPVYAAESS
eukprot:CFRG0648T1